MIKLTLLKRTLVIVKEISFEFVYKLLSQVEH